MNGRSHFTESRCPVIGPKLRAPRRFFVGQVANLRPIGNRPAASTLKTLRASASMSSMVWRRTGVTEDFRSVEEADYQSAAG